MKIYDNTCITVDEVLSIVNITMTGVYERDASNFHSHMSFKFLQEKIRIACGLSNSGSCYLRQFYSGVCSWQMPSLATVLSYFDVTLYNLCSLCARVCVLVNEFLICFM